jgi:hypothetical protein
MEMQMTISVAVEEWSEQPNTWTVEAIGQDGEVYQAIFLGPEAKERAYEYARLRYDFRG